MKFGIRPWPKEGFGSCYRESRFERMKLQENLDSAVVEKAFHPASKARGDNKLIDLVFHKQIITLVVLYLRSLGREGSRGLTVSEN